MENDDLTWNQLCELEPGLLDLLAEVKSVKDDKSKPSFCANAVWYGENGHTSLKSRMSSLVGWYAKSLDPRVRSPRAYDLAVDNLYSKLPGCRNCRCF